jgi:hypothetical protein
MTPAAFLVSNPTRSWNLHVLASLYLPRRPSAKPSYCRIARGKSPVLAMRSPPSGDPAGNALCAVRITVLARTPAQANRYPGPFVIF